jgi:hypothetical protein
MRQLLVAARLAEVLRVVRNKAEAIAGSGILHEVGIGLDQDGVVDSVSLPVERSLSFDGALRGPQFDIG